MNDTKENLKKYLKDKVDNEGLTGVSGSRFVDTVSPKGKEIKKNTTVEEYVDRMDEDYAKESLQIFKAIEAGETMPVRESFIMEDFVPDLERLKTEKFNEYRYERLLEYAIELEKKVYELDDMLNGQNRTVSAHST